MPTAVQLQQQARSARGELNQQLATVEPLLVVAVTVVATIVWSYLVHLLAVAAREVRCDGLGTFLTKSVIRMLMAVPFVRQLKEKELAKVILVG